MNLFGIVPLTISYIALLAIVISYPSYASNQYAQNKAFAVLYINLCLAVYFFSKPLLNGSVYLTIDPVVARNWNIAFLIIALSSAIEIFLVTTIPHLFYNSLLTSLANLLSSVSVMRFMGFGIINVVWSVIFTGTLCGYLLAQFFFADIKNQVAVCQRLSEFQKKRDYISYLKSEVDKYLKITVQAYLGLAASIGVSMTILFKAGAEAWTQFDYQVTAVLMVLAFLLVSVGALFAVAKPYLEITEDISSIYKNMY
ncbi:MAG TPA: hypothetical protein VMF88_10590 [Bacteroidota bacterium]|nr:hypothetical protein [Bacteroidota bacterium]